MTAGREHRAAGVPNGRWSRLAWAAIGALATVVLGLLGAWIGTTDAAVREHTARLAAVEAESRHIREQLNRLDAKLDRLEEKLDRLTPAR